MDGGYGVILLIGLIVRLKNMNIGFYSPYLTPLEEGEVCAYACIALVGRPRRQTFWDDNPSSKAHKVALTLTFRG